MALYDDRGHDDFVRQMRCALRAGRADDLERDLAFLLRARVTNSARQDAAIREAFLADLTEGVSPYHVAGGYPIPGTGHWVSVPRDVMPPGYATDDMVAVIQEVAGNTAVRWVADVGAGCGVLGVTALAAVPGAAGVFIDRDPRACACSLRNLVTLGLAGRGRVVQGDLLSPVTRDHRIDLLLANLPFMPEAWIRRLSPRWSVHAPPVAVSGGDDGLVYFRGLIPGLPAYVAPGGVVVLQVGPGQKPLVRDLLGERWTDVATAAGQDNIVVVTPTRTCS